MEKNNYIVYKYTSPSGKIYIGQTIYIDNPSIRWGINGIGYKK